MIQVLLELLQQKKRTIIAAVALLVLNVAFAALVAGYLQPRIDKSLVQRNDLRQRVAASDKIDIGTIYRRGTDDLKTLFAKIPAKREFSRVLGELLDSASANSLEIGNISYKPQGIKDRKLLAYGLAMTVNGTYAGLKSYLGDLQNFENMVVIDGISFTKNDLYEELVSMDLHLTVYLQGGDGI